jgi:DNA polymerase III delta prime subunit
MSDLFHAYVIGGDKEAARALAAEMLAPYGTFGPANPDYFLSEHVSFGIDEARSVRAWQELGASGERKVALIVADFLTREAENALLKTFEEPVSGTHLFLIVPNPDALLPTLLSRVQVLWTEGERTSGLPAAKKFLAMSLPERIAFVAKLAEKGDDEEAAAEVRERTRAFMDALEAALGEDPQKNAHSLETVLSLKRYLYMSGASSKMLLETIALTF